MAWVKRMYCKYRVHVGTWDVRMHVMKSTCLCEMRIGQHCGGCIQVVVEMHLHHWGRSCQVAQPGVATHATDLQQLHWVTRYVSQ